MANNRAKRSYVLIANAKEFIGFGQFTPAEVQQYAQQWSKDNKKSVHYAEVAGNVPYIPESAEA